MDEIDLSKIDHLFNPGTKFLQFYNLQERRLNLLAPLVLLLYVHKYEKN